MRKNKTLSNLLIQIKVVFREGSVYLGKKTVKVILEEEKDNGNLRRKVEYSSK